MTVDDFGLPNGSNAWRGKRVLVLSPTPTHPQDYGNRKRFFRICSELKDRGARIVFLHYPAEIEWRERIPEHTVREMADAWHLYYQLPVGRPLHTSPAGSHHTIDEWWDESIAVFLTWLFATDNFDVFIVNYTWLSKAFEFAPKSVVKILDTNDLFSRRKEMLLLNGVEPEYFYTTRDEEATGIQRADIVWAIKDQERAEFERMTKKAVLTMPHLDAVRDCPALAPDPDGYLRVGIIGAQNNVNRSNIGAFLEAAIPVFDRYFAPIRIVLGGTICRLIGNYDQRFVKLFGEIDDIGRFYAAVDVAAIPMAFSTGLKIKAGEAISLNFPVVSLAHAFEGYPARHPFHSLSNFREMAERLVDISFDRNLLRGLRAASVKSRETVEKSIAQTFDATGALVRSMRKTVLYCIDMGALAPDGAMRIAAESAVQYLRMMSDVVVAIVGGRSESCPRQLPDFLNRCRVFAASEQFQGSVAMEFLASRGIEIEAFEDFIVSGAVIVADALAPWMSGIEFSDTTMVIRGEVIAVRGAARIPHDWDWMIGKFRRLVLVGNVPSGDLSALGNRLNAEVAIAPCLWRSASVKDVFGPRRARAPARVALLGASRMTGGAHIAGLLRDIEAEPILVDFEQDTIGNGKSASSCTAQEFVDKLLDPREPLPQFAVDLSFGALGLQYVRELLQRARIPIVTAEGRRDALGLAGSHGSGRASTLFTLFQEVSELVLSPRKHARERVRQSFEELEGDGGWAWLWQYVAKTRDGQAEEFI